MPASIARTAPLRIPLLAIFAGFALTCLVLAFPPLIGPAAAQSNDGIQPSTCIAVAENRYGPRIKKPSVIPAAFAPGELAKDEVGITYVGHSAFRIETPEGVAIVTDYSGFAGDGPPPDAVTMNHAHSSHYTDYPSPHIPNLLRGWNPDGDEPARHYLQLKDVLIRNVTTDLYSGGTMIEKDGNSIFIFEVAGLCIGHLGHLHHTLTPEHIARIGRIDILFVPVDGNYTMSLAGMIDLAGQLRSSMVIPMHFFSIYTLQRFVAGMEEKFEIDIATGNSTKVSLRTLPERPKVLALSPY